jgi:hypothetical protein
MRGPRRSWALLASGVTAACSGSGNNYGYEDEAGVVGDAGTPDRRDGSVGTGGAKTTTRDVVLKFSDQVSPAPSADWVNVTSTLAGMSSECGNLSHFSSNPKWDMLIAGVAKMGLWASGDGGDSWKSIGDYGDTITNRPSWIAYDPVDPYTFWESGIYNDGGVYQTTDNGYSFTMLGDVTHCDSVSIDFTDPARKFILAGPHEAMRKLWRSSNGGAAWEDIGQNLPGGTAFSSQAFVLSAKESLVGIDDWGGGMNAVGGIYQSSDGGESYGQVSDAPVVNQPLVASDNALYWSKRGSGGLLKSVDRGMSWVEIADSTKVKALRPVELPDGRIVAVGPTTLMISADRGATWQPLGPPLPYAPNGLSYSPFRKAFYISRSDCGSSVPMDAIERLGFDYTL